jgi:hypothetical protein
LTASLDTDIQMLVAHPAVRAVHANHHLNAAVRYTAVRLAELVDPGTPFVLSGASYCDPLAATATFASVASDHLANSQLRYGTVLAASQLLADALEQERNLRLWYPGDLTRLLVILAKLRKVPGMKTVGDAQPVRRSYSERTSWVRQRLQALVDGSLARFQAAIDDPCDGYRAKLFDDLYRRLDPAPSSEREWAELEHDLCYVSALLLADGRDGRELAPAIASSLVECRDDASAVAAIRGSLACEPADHQVALVLSGTRSVDRESAAAFGIDVVERPGARWAQPASATAAADLAAFVDEQAPAADCAPLLVRVEAWDRGQARVRAILAAEALQDHLVVEHPDQRFAIKPAVLVLSPDGDTTARVGMPAGAISEGRVPRYSNAAELLPFLRANALARQETSPVLKIVHTWIALEYLGREQDPAARRDVAPALSLRLDGYLPPYLASAAAISGLRGLLVASWRALRALGRDSARRRDWLRLELWLGVRDEDPDLLARFVDLLRALDRPSAPPPDGLDLAAPVEEAAELLRDVAGEIGPFAVRRLEVLGRQFDHGSRLAKVAEGIQMRTLIATARLKLARHLAVHQGFNAEQATAPLALSGVHMLDSAFEVLQRWMRPGYQAWQAMADARRWHDENLASWRSVADIVIDGDHLIHPQKR